VGYPIGRLGRRVIVRAYQEANLAGRTVVGTGYLLLGIVRDEGAVGRLLATLGVSLDGARAAVEAEAVRTAQPGPLPGRPVLSVGAIRALAAAGERAEGRHARRVTPQDILAAVVSEETGAAGRVLSGMGVDVAALREDLPPDDEEPSRGPG
jgi:ATP-dependent Clp protease ATP-binding subunit ClpA